MWQETFIIALSEIRVLLSRKYCLDALSYVGTSEAFQVLKKISKQEELQRMLLGLASAPRPTVDHIEAVWVG